MANAVRTLILDDRQSPCGSRRHFPLAPNRLASWFGDHPGILGSMALAAFLITALLAVPLAAAQPNILWISSEDNGPHLGVYGDSYADTPNLDALGRMGMIYRNAWSTAPVCAPARTTIISGMYPPSTGSQHMRSLTRLPADMRMFPQYLREAGYYVSNNSKEDYNL